MKAFGRRRALVSARIMMPAFVHANPGLMMLTPAGDDLAIPESGL